MCSQLSSKMPDSSVTKRRLIDTYKRTSSSFTLVPDIPHFFCQLNPFHHPKLQCGGHENAASYCRKHNWLRVQGAALSSSLCLHQDHAEHGLLPTSNWVRESTHEDPFLTLFWDIRRLWQSTLAQDSKMALLNLLSRLPTSCFSSASDLQSDGSSRLPQLTPYFLSCRLFS